MSVRAPSLAELVEPLRAALALQGPLPAQGSARVSSAGFFDPVHPAAVQVLGDAAAAWLASLPAAERAALPARLRAGGVALTIATEGADPAPWGAVTSPRPAHEVVYALRQQLAAVQAARRVTHGVLVRVHGVGALITGAPGAGKGSLALELLARGHVLVADDAVELERPAPGVLIGRAPAVLSGYIEVRDLGVLDVRKMHGRGATRTQCRIDVIIALLPRGARPAGAAQRLGGRRTMRRLLGVSLPVRSLPARSGHNLAPLVEAACLDQRLRDEGVNAVDALTRRQARAIAKSK